MKLADANKVQGKISSMQAGPVNSLISIELTAPSTIKAMVSAEEIGSLELAEGKTVCAIFKPASIMLGICQESSKCDCD